MLIDIKVNDVRRKSDLSDYTGELGVGSSLRVTDKANGPTGREDGTMSDATELFTVACAATADTQRRQQLQRARRPAKAVVPGLVTGGKRAIWELGQVSVYDGGARRRCRHARVTTRCS